MPVVMRGRGYPAWVSYGGAVACVVAAVLIRLSLDRWLGHAYPFATYFFAVLVAASAWGTEAGVTAALLGAVAVNYVLLEPRGQFVIADHGENVGQILNLLLGFAIAAVSGAMRRAQAAAHHVALAEQRQQIELRSVLQNALDGIMTIDGRGLIQSFNPAAERLFGYAASEVVGQNVGVLVPEPERSRHDAYLASYLETGTPKIIGIGREVTGQRKDGSTFPLSLAVSEFSLDGRRYFTGVLHDLTAQHRLERQLRQAQKMEAFGQLAGGVAHDFNNLLTIILGNTEILLETIHEPDRALMVDVYEAGERAATLTRQLLAFSRQQVLEPKVLNLNDTVLTIGRMLNRLIGEDVAFTSRLDPSIPTVKVDPGQIEQVLVNLAVNARDAMPHGGTLTIETSEVDWRGEAPVEIDFTPGRYVVLAMTDTGCGMTPQVQAQIFEPFFTTKGHGKGTGLGLATVFGIIKQSGGHVRVYSEVGVGTVFKIYLPATEELPANARDMTAQAVRHGSETVLLVEDEAKVRGIAALSLQSHGYRVLAASGAEEALALFERQEDAIAMVVTDVVMPDMSGRALVEAIRARRPAMRVLYVSGYTDDAIVRHGVIEAKEAFLQKPFSPSALTRKVRDVLDALDPI